MSGQYTGSKWGVPGVGNPGGQVTWSFGTLSSVLLSFDQSITAAPFQASIRAAFDLWERAANIDFVEVVDSMSSDIRLAWDSYDGAGGTLAKAIWQYYGTTTSYSEIGFDLGDVWRASASAGPSGNDFFAVAVHEIGHAIGLAHTDQHDSIMYPYLGSQSGPSAADIQAIQALYGAPSGVAGLRLQGASTDDTIVGTAASDHIEAHGGNDVVSGNAGNDFLQGNAGNDIINGNQGDDTVRGGQGDDLLQGGQGHDFIFGDLGNDRISGDHGNDTLTGGAGADRFVFSAGQGADVVTDFSFLEGDRLDLQGQSFAVASAGADTMLTLSGGGSIRLLGVTATEFDAFAIV